MGLLRKFSKIFTGTHLRNPAVRARPVQTIEFGCAGPADAMIDDEVISLWPERIDILPGALEVRV
jgi:diacylglycerol kinase (ATP)